MLPASLWLGLQSQLFAGIEATRFPPPFPASKMGCVPVSHHQPLFLGPWPGSDALTCVVMGLLGVGEGLPLA